MPVGRLEVMQQLDAFVAGQLPALLADSAKCWQPSDFVPDLAGPDGLEEVFALRDEAAGLPDDVLHVLVGDMITEEALPSYAQWIATIEGVDAQGEPATAWGAWNRGWCAEENRHGDLLSRYLYLSGRVNMRAIEETVHNLIRDGGDTQAGRDPYRVFIYTSFQEIATRISHVNVGRLARAAGAERLSGICRRIAGDEHRHAGAFMLFISKFLEIDASEVVLAFQDMMKKRITMPAMYMREKGLSVGETFAKFERVAARTSVYTPLDYVQIMTDLLAAWRIEHLSGLTPAAEQAQAYLCALPDRYRKVAERFAERAPMEGAETFSWLQPAGSRSTV